MTMYHIYHTMRDGDHCGGSHPDLQQAIDDAVESGLENWHIEKGWKPFTRMPVVMDCLQWARQQQQRRQA